jgi:hypothetical protein
MTDVYVYYFVRRRGPVDDESVSKRRATLEAIKSIGKPIMESQIVVDHTEVDGNGFQIGGVDHESHPMDDRWPQIRSLERRAAARDCEALQLNEMTDGSRKYLLGLESRELRRQAQVLRKQRTDAMAGELGVKVEADVLVTTDGLNYWMDAIVDVDRASAMDSAPTPA